MQLKKILHVDDDESIRDIVEIALVDLSGFTLVSTSSGQEAIERLEHFQPDLILLDVMMPEMDGLETLRRIRIKSETQRTPVVFMTARVQENEKQQYLKAGAVSVIEKPFDAACLGDQLTSIFLSQS
ncbi:MULTISPECIES: response regulator [Nitrincola]|uniref:Transcriptional regulatory protein YycF n=1 Tax=Nitrincola nitratireducens TaxID=1229521 RepID=W9UXP1_9GAMM|nr:MULTISPECIES: response regulator [Nitrincola]EXJ12028.1 Transcriptional regulatory protein YycF [Nitrincola nitratireducens]